MLSKKDKEWLTEMVEERIKFALTISVQYEMFDKEAGRTIFKDEDVYLPIWWVEYLPKFMGSIQGLHADVSKANNKMSDNHEGLNAIANILMGIEGGISNFIEVSNQLKIDNSSKQLNIEDKNDTCISK